MTPRPLWTWAALASLTLSMSSASLAADKPALATVMVQAASAQGSQTSLDAVVEAVRQSTLSAQVPGAVVALMVQAGDRVKAGQALLRIDARAAEQNVASSSAQVAAAEASRNVAAKDLERQQQLFQKQYISQAALDRAQAQWQAAQAQVQALQAQTRAAEAQSGFFVVRAPYAGVVSDVPATLGDMVMPGRPLVVMHDPAALRVVAAVPQSWLAGLSAQLKDVRYELTGVPGHSGQRAPTQIQLLPTVDAASHTAVLRLTLPAGLQGVTPGLFVRVWLPERSAVPGAAERLYLPASATVQRGEMSGVYVVDAQGQARLRQVRLGRATGERVELLSGVAKGEKVAADPQAVSPR